MSLSPLASGSRDGIGAGIPAGRGEAPREARNELSANNLGKTRVTDIPTSRGPLGGGEVGSGRYTARSSCAGH